MRSAIAIATLAAAALVAGCGGSEVLRPTVSVSVGQQLIDLRKARDSGAIAERDYAVQKRRLIEDTR